MPVPFEALIPFGELMCTSYCVKADQKGLLTVMFGATGTLFSVVKRAQNDWKVSHLFRLDRMEWPQLPSDRFELTV